MRQPEFEALVRDPRLLDPVRRLLCNDVYVYQFKINVKAPFYGEKWAWHQDFPAWRICDNLPEPRQVNVGVFLDAFNEFNGPVIFVPGSHRSGPALRDRDGRPAEGVQHFDPEEIALSEEELRTLVEAHGMTSPKGPAGSTVFFSSQIVHGSAHNISPFPRTLLLVTYNDASNQPRAAAEPRPAEIVCRDARPLRPLDAPFTEFVKGALGT
jgi:ectoine hydroxylase